MMEIPITQQHPQRKQQQHHKGIWELGTGITELSGEGGSGKTQICLSLCVDCAMTPLPFPTSDGGCDGDGCHYTALYVSMGEGIPAVAIATRLEKMVRARLGRDDPGEIRNVLSQIGLLSLRNEEEFIEFVERDLPTLLNGQSNGAHGQSGHRRPTKIGLIALDGIAGFFRFSDPLFQRSRNSMFHFQRSSRLLRVSAHLRRLSDAHDVHVLITNQVSAFIPPTLGGGSSDPSSFIPTTPEQVVPALGLVWSNCVTTRYILRRGNGTTAMVPYENIHRADDDSRQKDVIGSRCKKLERRELRLRKARVLQSVNMSEEREVQFVIDAGGAAAL